MNIDEARRVLAEVLAEEAAGLDVTRPKAALEFLLDRRGPCVVAKPGSGDYLGTWDLVVAEAPEFVIVECLDQLGAEWLLGRLASGLRCFCPEGPFPGMYEAFDHVRRYFPLAAAEAVPC